MEFIKPGLNLDIIGKTRWFIGISVVLCLASIGALLFRGLNYGIDFVGGTEVQVKFSRATSEDEIRAALAVYPDLQFEVQLFGDRQQNEYLVKIPNVTILTVEKVAALRAGLERTFAGSGFRRFYESQEGGGKVSFLLDAEVPDGAIREVFAAAGVPALDIAHQGTPGRYTYQVVAEGIEARIAAALKKSYGDGVPAIVRLDSVGPKVSEQLKNQGVLAVIYSLIGILIYVAFRFEWKFAPGGVVALMHDSLIALGVYAITGTEFSLPAVASILTLVGYSINDTIVVYDRIRENMKEVRTRPLVEIVNASINQTLSRTILTSLATWMTIAAIYFFGGEILKGFALGLLVGIIVGTYSSIYIASPLTLLIDNWTKKAKAR